MNYDFSAIEKKWHEYWEKNDTADVNGFCVCPQALQGVELTGFLGEHVNNDGAVVQQFPGIATVAFPAQHGLAQLFQGILGIIAEGTDMGVGGTGANQKIVSQGADSIDLQQLDVHALLLVQSFGYCKRDFFRG